MKKVRFEDLKQDELNLVVAAETARKNAFTPYFKYKVGAAVLATNLKIYFGCNIEMPTCKGTHAEVHAINEMVIDGERRILAICCVAENGGIPCADGCLQWIWSFSGRNRDLKIIGVDSKRNITLTTIGELYPHPFGPWDLGVDPEKY